ncbi:hypothetical protein DYH55_17055 [Methylovirgula sp. 4M-Z18]|nr:hypothetical protein DYH55_17055 [Methylovirgula sp. 4M-Z18]
MDIRKFIGLFLKGENMIAENELEQLNERMWEVEAALQAVVRALARLSPSGLKGLMDELQQGSRNGSVSPKVEGLCMRLIDDAMDAADPMGNS